MRWKVLRSTPQMEQEVIKALPEKLVDFYKSCRKLSFNEMPEYKLKKQPNIATTKTKKRKDKLSVPFD